MPTQPVAPIKPASKQRISDSKLRVVIAGGGVAALEATLALRQLAPDQTGVTLIAPSAEFVYRPMTVCQPFASPRARRCPVAPIAARAGATLLADDVACVDSSKRIVHTAAGEKVHYDALLVAIGAQARPLYQHALTLDDRNVDKTVHSLIQDVEGGYIDSLAFVIPARTRSASRNGILRSRAAQLRPRSFTAWSLPVYELALMAAQSAHDMNIDLTVSIITSEDAPLACLGRVASTAVVELLRRTGIHVITSAHAEIPRPGRY